STGEQKALLIGLVLAHAGLLAQMSGFAPVLLLDEVVAHLDPSRRAALYAEVERLGGPARVAGGGAATFSGVAGNAGRVEGVAGTRETADVIAAPRILCHHARRGPSIEGACMRAAYYETNGTAREVLRVGELETPQPGRGEVRVRLAVSGVNPSDVKSRAGL